VTVTGEIATMTERIVRRFDPLAVILFNAQARTLLAAVRCDLEQHGFTA
jgi:hypothetical protein